MQFAYLIFQPSRIHADAGAFEAVVIKQGRVEERIYWSYPVHDAVAEGELDEIAALLQSMSFIAVPSNRIRTMVESQFAEGGIRCKIRWLPVKEFEKFSVQLQVEANRIETSVTRNKRRSPAERLWHLIETFPEDIREVLYGQQQENLPLKLDSFIRNRLPESPGVYYFLDRNKRPMYIGKAVNLRKRVISHFSSTEEIMKLLRLRHQLDEIQVEETGSELVAGLLEDHEIRHYWPPMNKAQKTRNDTFAVVHYTDRIGRHRLSVAKTRRNDEHIAHFHTYPMAASFLIQISGKYHIDPALLNVYSDQVPDQGYDSNGLKKFLNAFHQHRTIEIHLMPGFRPDETGFVLFQNATFQGFGFLPKQQLKKPQITIFLKALRRCRTSVTTEKLLFSALQELSPDFTFQVSKGSMPQGKAPRYSRALVMDLQLEEFP